jgi:predicted RNA binding protein YcfA (HicA-like mRNA interferase family)
MFQRKSKILASLLALTLLVANVAPAVAAPRPDGGGGPGIGPAPGGGGGRGAGAGGGGGGGGSVPGRSAPRDPRPTPPATRAPAVTPEDLIAAKKVGKVIKLLEKDGWRLARQNGSHRQFKHPDKSGLVTVAGKSSATIPRGTLGSIVRQAGLPRARSGTGWKNGSSGGHYFE